MTRVLVADDNPMIREVVRRHLERDGLRVLECGDGDMALGMLTGRRAEKQEIELAVLDALLPGRDGLEICRSVRAGGHRPETPIILVSDLGDHDHRVRGLEAGADDYLPKPFSPRELALRVSAVLRRTRRCAEPVRSDLRDGSVRVLPDAQLVLVAGAPVELAPREYRLLVFLMGHPGQVFSRADLLAQVWGWDFGDLSTVTVHIKRLRSKLGADHRITTLWGRGYAWGRTDVAARPGELSYANARITG